MFFDRRHATIACCARSARNFFSVENRVYKKTTHSTKRVVYHSYPETSNDLGRNFRKIYACGNRRRSRVSIRNIANRILHAEEPGPKIEERSETQTNPRQFYGPFCE